MKFTSPKLYIRPILKWGSYLLNIPKEEKMTKATKRQFALKNKKECNCSHKKCPSKKIISVKTGIRAGSGDDYGFTSCQLR